MEEVDKMKPYYMLSLRISHPSVDPADITAVLGIEPKYTWKVGEQAKTPTGTPLYFTRNQSYWYCRSYTEEKQFGIEINQILAFLSPHQEFFHQLVAEGGQVEIYLQLPGSINIGDTLSAEIIAQLANLKANLSIEVFPNMQRGNCDTAH